MTRLKHVMALSSDVEYLNSRDATIMGSRNGHAAIYLWYALTKKGYEGFREDVEKCMRNAHFLREMLRRSGIWAMLNELSNTVVFERPNSEAFIRKWQVRTKSSSSSSIIIINHHHHHSCVCMGGCVGGRYFIFLHIFTHVYVDDV